MREDSTPSAHSSVERSYSPYSSPRLMALGLRGKTWCPTRGENDRTDVIRTLKTLFIWLSDSTDLDNVVVAVSPVVQGGEGFLQDSPGHALPAARLTHHHGGVARVFGLVQLDDFGHRERSHLQTDLLELRLHGPLQLQKQDKVM